MADMTIRRATAADIPQIDELLRQVLEVHHAGRPDLFKGGAKKYTDEELKTILADDQTPVFVAVASPTLPMPAMPNQSAPHTQLKNPATPAPSPSIKCSATHSAYSSNTPTVIF